MLDIFDNLVTEGNKVAYAMVVYRSYEMRTGIVEEVFSRDMIGYAKIRSDKTGAVVTRRCSEIAKDMYHVRP